MVETTLQKINQIAIAEFLEKGFRGASLREIVKKAGVTTGAFYGYYKSKEELFSALVKPHADYVLEYFKKKVDEFMSVPKEEWAAKMTSYSRVGINAIYEYAYANKIAFKLILKASAGTVFENFIHDLVELEIEATHIFYKEMESQGCSTYSLNKNLEHMIISGEFSALFELIIHDIPKEEGLQCVDQLYRFYEAAWYSFLN